MTKSHKDQRQYRKKAARPGGTGVADHRKRLKRRKPRRDFKQCAVCGRPPNNWVHFARMGGLMELSVPPHPFKELS